MDLILRHLNARGLLIAVVTIAAFTVLVKYYDAPYRWYEDRRFEAERGAVRASDIAADLEARESLKLRSLYRDVSAEIAAAQARGRPLEGLQASADAAVKLDAPDTRAYAMETLNRLRLAIPQPLDALRPSNAGDEPSDRIATPPSSAPRSARRRTRSR